MSDINEQELVSTLVFQHQVLRSDIITISVHATSTEEGCAALVLADMSKFKIDLHTHLTLENETFYVDYLDKKRKAHEDVEQLEIFIEQMDVIGKVVTLFLTKYSTVGNIAEGLGDGFEKRLNEIADMLNVRMETEESSVYRTYLDMSTDSNLPDVAAVSFSPGE